MDVQREHSFIEAVQDKRKAMWRVAYSILKSEAEAEDAVSAAVENTWRNLYRLRSLEALPVYLMKSTINAAKREWRRRKRMTFSENFDAYLPPVEAENGDITDYLNELDEKYRLPLLLKFGENLLETEIAQVLGLPRGTISSRISRGLDMLRRGIEKEDSRHD